MKTFIAHNSKDQIKVDNLSRFIIDTSAVLNKFTKTKKRLGLYFDLAEPITSTLVQPCTSPLSEKFFYSLVNKQIEDSCHNENFHQEATICYSYVDNSIINSLSVCEPSVSLSDFKTYNSPITLIEDPELYIDKISEFYQALKKSKHQQLRKLAEDIKVNLNEPEEAVIYAVEKLLEFEVKHENSLDRASRYRKYIIVRLATRLGRDLRRGYRNIVHFFFKNMDDNSGADADTLFKTFNVIKQVLVNNQLNYNDNRRNNRVFRAVIA